MKITCFQNSNPKIPVIMYHDFMKHLPAEDPFNYQYITTPECFEENIRTLLSENYTPISLKELYKIKIHGKKAPKKPFVITFDDGLLGQYTIAYPIIKKYLVHTVMYVTTDLVGKNVDNKEYFTWDNAKKMQKSKLVEITSHGKRHIPYNEVPILELQEDIQESFDTIEENLGKSVLKLFSYPFGMHNDQTILTLKNMGVDMQATGLGMNQLNEMDLWNIQRINIPYGMTGKEIVDVFEQL